MPEPNGEGLPPREGGAARVDAHLRRNYAAHYLHGMLGLTGFRILYAPTFIPAYLMHMSGSAAFVGLGQALQQLGMVLSPVAGAAQIEHRQRILPVAALLGLLMRLQILGLAVVGWLLGGAPALVLTLVLLFLLGLFSGSQRVAFQVLMAKVIPLKMRGRLQAWRNFTGGIVAAGLAYLSGVWFIEGEVLGNGYATTFLLVFVLTSLGLWALQRLLVEPEAAAPRLAVSFRQRLRECPALLRDRNYRVFLLAQALAVGARVASPFYVYYASRKLQLDGATLGLLSLAYLGADTVSNLLWGYLGDATGFRRSFILSVLLWAASIALLILAGNRTLILLAFFGLGAAASGYVISTATMILEFGAPRDVPMRLALSATVEGAIATAAPLIGGVIVALGSDLMAFGLAIALLSASLLVMLVWLKEPRRHVPAQVVEEDGPF